MTAKLDCDRDVDPVCIVNDPGRHNVAGTVDDYVVCGLPPINPAVSGNASTPHNMPVGATDPRHEEVRLLVIPNPSRCHHIPLRGNNQSVDRVVTDPPSATKYRAPSLGTVSCGELHNGVSGLRGR